MNEVSRTATSDTAICPSWCSVDHEAGDVACQTSRRQVVRIPTVPGQVSTVHGFRVLDGDKRVSLNGQYYSLEAARAYARQILEVVDEMDDAHPDALTILIALGEVTGTDIEALADDLGIDLGAATAADVDRAAMALGERAGRKV